METQKKIALITGASKGIGRAIAIALAEKGFIVALHYNNDEQAVISTLELLKGNGHTCFGSDLTISENIQLLISNVLSTYGRIDVLVNNAGIYMEKPFIGMELEEWMNIWKLTTRLNLDAPAHLSFLTAKVMKQQGCGRMINITSRGAFRGEPDAPAYGASKAGLNSFGQSFSKALAPDGILVFTVAPGFVETDMAKDALEGHRGASIKQQSPLNRAATPEEIGNLVTYLATDAPAYLTGCIIDINGASYLRN